jgi:Zn-finger nucleic acid-binding protein
MAGSISMDCPKCRHALSEFKTHEGVIIDICDSCKGVWFDRGEVAAYADLTRDIPELQQVWRNATVTRNPCPRCRVPLEEMQYSTQDPLLIDRCPACGGIWLDSGELGKVMELAQRGGTRSKVFDAIQAMRKSP